MVLPGIGCVTTAMSGEVNVVMMFMTGIQRAVSMQLAQLSSPSFGFTIVCSIFQVLAYQQILMPSHVWLQV